METDTVDCRKRVLDETVLDHEMDRRPSKRLECGIPRNLELICSFEPFPGYWEDGATFSVGVISKATDNRVGTHMRPVDVD